MEDKIRVINALRMEGFDIEQALEICADDVDLYMDVLMTALEEGRRKLPIIEESAKNKNYERYHIEVHGLKNAMRAIGAIELSILALEQEMAAKKQEYETIESGFEKLTDKYRAVIALLGSVLEG